MIQSSFSRFAYTQIMNRLRFSLLLGLSLAVPALPAQAEELLLTLNDLKWLVRERMFKGQDKLSSSFLGCTAAASKPRVALQDGKLVLTIFGEYDCLAMHNALDIAATAEVFAAGDVFGLRNFDVIETPDGLLNMLLGRVLSSRKQVNTRLQEALARKRNDESELDRQYVIQRWRVASDGIHLTYQPQTTEIAPQKTP